MYVSKKIAKQLTRTIEFELDSFASRWEPEQECTLNKTYNEMCLRLNCITRLSKPRRLL